MSIPHGDIRRMPLGYGPAPGPRQNANGEHISAGTVETLSVSIVADVAEADVARILPEPFTLAEPQVIVGLHRLRNISWLAGRGYNILDLRGPARGRGTTATVEGDYVSVLWENRAEPIITGREELGFAKIYAEIDDVCDTQQPGPTINATASWDTHRFFELAVEDIAEAPPIRPARARLHRKYIPATERWDQADVDYPVLTPANDPARRTIRTWTGNGEFRFLPGTFSELPTMDYIVNTLAAMRVLAVSPAQIVLSEGGKSLADQTRIELRR